MSDPRWLDVENDVVAAVRHFSDALRLRESGAFAGERFARIRDEMALMHLMQSPYNASEAALVRVLALIREKPPAGGDWHKALIDRTSRSVAGSLARPAILPPDVAADLHEARTFRHRAIHNYDDFDIAKAQPSLDAAQRLVNTFPAAIAAFRAVIDPDV